MSTKPPGAAQTTALAVSSHNKGKGREQNENNMDVERARHSVCPTPSSSPALCPTAVGKEAFHFDGRTEIVLWPAEPAEMTYTHSKPETLAHTVQPA
jgi:hypothetical protein